jgi:hypothetical protein
MYHHVKLWPSRNRHNVVLVAESRARFDSISNRGLENRWLVASVCRSLYPGYRFDLRGKSALTRCYRLLPLRGIGQRGCKIVQRRSAIVSG